MKANLFLDFPFPMVYLLTINYLISSNFQESFSNSEQQRGYAHFLKKTSSRKEFFLGKCQPLSMDYCPEDFVYSSYFTLELQIISNSLNSSYLL
jgi:hypothetical protein